VRIPGYDIVQSGTSSTNNHISCQSRSSPLYLQLITLELLQEASPFSVKCGSTDSIIRRNNSAVSTLNPSKMSLSQESFNTNKSLSLLMAPLKFLVHSSKWHHFPNQAPYLMVNTEVKLSILCA